jgi:hypothetical protein
VIGAHGIGVTVFLALVNVPDRLGAFDNGPLD